MKKTRWFNHIIIKPFPNDEIAGIYRITLVMETQEKKYIVEWPDGNLSKDSYNR